MKQYIPNSPEAMSRVVAMMIVTDAHIDDREIAVLDRLDAYTLLGLSRGDFMKVARDYCSELVAEAEEFGGSPVLDADRTDRVIDQVDVRERRILVARLLMAVIAADMRQRESEKLVFDHILDRWSLTLNDVVRMG
jgi:uncharacterized tellurite resistance protein B-like protein